MVTITARPNPAAGDYEVTCMEGGTLIYAGTTPNPMAALNKVITLNDRYPDATVELGALTTAHSAPEA